MLSFRARIACSQLAFVMPFLVVCYWFTVFVIGLSQQIPSYVHLIALGGLLLYGALTISLASSYEARMTSKGVLLNIGYTYPEQVELPIKKIRWFLYQETSFDLVLLRFSLTEPGLAVMGYSVIDKKDLPKFLALREKLHKPR